jgi:hypothetical protein
MLVHPQLSLVDRANILASTKKFKQFDRKFPDHASIWADELSPYRMSSPATGIRAKTKPSLHISTFTKRDPTRTFPQTCCEQDSIPPPPVDPTHDLAHTDLYNNNIFEFIQQQKKIPHSSAIWRECSRYLHSVNDYSMPKLQQWH